MKSTLLIFGAYGALGKGVSQILINKGYDNIYLFGSKITDDIKIIGPNIFNITVSDLSLEKNVSEAFKDITTDKNTEMFLFSTIGGFKGGKTLSETDVSDIDKMLNINFKINFLLAKNFTKLIQQSAGGSICFTSAYTGLHAEAKKGAYGISKSALNHLVHTLAIEGRETGLSANAIAPYIIDTPDNRQWMKSSNYEAWIKPEDIGEIVYGIFKNYKTVSGQVFELKERLL